ncbi:MAG: 8-oxo-dGTP diphosphatase [Lentisphaeraceae bacterium]|nr:8-oxo-dGTP diphosphatase [Lentisphaeraceae bacterium]
MKTIEATLVYVFKDDKCLMLHRIKKDEDIHKNKWNGLGGKMESGESPEECAKREVLEESGLSIDSPKFAGHLFFPNFDKQQNHWSVFIFTANQFTGELIENCPEGELHWIPSKDILELNLWEGDKKFLPMVLSGKTFLGKFNYADGRLVDFSLNCQI